MGSEKMDQYASDFKNSAYRSDGLIVYLNITTFLYFDLPFIYN